MSTMPSAERIGAAWRLHRNGDNSGAARMFQDIIAVAPESVDALYGLGLAQKAQGDNSAAAESFKQALSIAEQALTAVQHTSQAEGHHGDNDLESNFDDRYMMLTRMLSQRIEDVSA